MKVTIQKTIKDQVKKRVRELSDRAYRAIVEDRLDQAELFYKNAIEVTESELPEDSRLLADTLHKLAVLYVYQGEQDKADPIINRMVEL